MSIFGINNNNSVNTAGSVNTLSNVNVTDENTNGMNILKSMTSGETLEGQVIGIEGDQVSVKLADNAVINARLDAAMGLIEGQNVIFQIQSGNDNSISLRPLFTNTAQEQIANNALLSAGLSVNSTTLSLVSNLMDEGMSIDKNSIMSVYRDIVNNPDMAVDKLVHMTKLGLEINPANVEQYDNICNLKDSFTNSVNTIVNEIPVEINNMMNNGAVDEATTLFKDCVQMIASQATEETNNVNPQTSQENNVNIISDAVINEAVENEAANTVTADDPSAMLKALMANIVVEEEATGNMKASESSVNDNNIATNITEFINNNPELSKSLGISNTDTLTNEQFFAKLNEAIQNNSINDKDIASLIKNNEFDALFKNALKDTWLLEPKDVQKAENVNDFYNRLNEQIHSIANSMEKVLGSNANLNQSINQLNQNLQFLDQMSHLMPYVSLPLKMNGEAQTGDLYVYANKKNLSEANDNITALLRLDMKYLGFMEVFVKLEGTNNVTTDFCLENEEVIDFLSANMDKLSDRLEERGYNINTSVRHKELKEDISKEFATNGVSPGGVVTTTMQNNPIGHFRFDVRA